MRDTLIIDNCHREGSITIRDDRNFTISVFKNDRDKVVVVVQEHAGWHSDGSVRELILGQKTVKKLPNLSRATSKPVRMRREVEGE